MKNHQVFVGRLCVTYSLLLFFIGKYGFLCPYDSILLFVLFCFVFAVLGIEAKPLHWLQ
jgi:hypothetical protein